MAAKAAPKKNLSALKRTRQAEALRLKNRSIKTSIKTITKKVEAAANSKDKDAIQLALAEAKTVISKAASKGIIHKNTASRKISRLSKLAHKTLTPAAA